MSYAKLALLLSKDKRVQALIPIIILMAALLLLVPLLVISSVVEILNSPNHYDQQIAQVKADFEIDNDLAAYLVRAIDFVQLGDLRTDSQEIYTFVSDYFVQSQEVEIEVEVQREVLVDGHMEQITETVTQTITKYYFMSLTEIMGMVSIDPFNFSAEDIELLQDLYFADQELEIVPTVPGKYPMPVKGYISSTYGQRADPLTGKLTMHPALDIVPQHHAPIITIADGIVVKVDTTQGNPYGNNITIRHEHDSAVFYSFSAHLSRIYVTEGMEVSQGTVIGLEGGAKTDPNPGRSTGHHLHFEIWKSATRSSHVNPLTYITIG